MFGIFRLGLALLVVVYHLSDHHIAGWYSVYAFYALSGFLMTLVINKKYELSRTGALRFALNRAFRIYPPYLAMCLFSLVLLNLPVFAQTAADLIQSPNIGQPDSLHAWLENVLIWGWHMRDPKLVPQVWTVFRELFYCVLIFGLFARFRWLALLWLALSLAFAASTVVRGVQFLEVYTSFTGASIAYSAGCCIHHFRKNLTGLTRPLGPLIAIAVLLPFAFEAVRPMLFDHTAVIPLYLNLVFSSYLVLLLSQVKASEWWQALDQRLGNLSYPIYLCHANVAVVVATLFGWHGESSDLLLVASLIPIVGCAWLINRYIEQTMGYGYDQRRQKALRNGSPDRRQPGFFRFVRP